MSHLTADLRYAWRTLRGSPVFTLVAALSIGLGIGANTAIFTLVDQVLLRLLPVKNPAQLVMLKGPNGDQHYGGNWGPNMLSYPMYADFRDHNDVFDGMFCRYPSGAGRGQRHDRPGECRPGVRQLLPGPRRRRRRGASHWARR